MKYNIFRCFQSIHTSILTLIMNGTFIRSTGLPKFIRLTMASKTTKRPSRRNYQVNWRKRKRGKNPNLLDLSPCVRSLLSASKEDCAKICDMDRALTFDPTSGLLCLKNGHDSGPDLTSSHNETQIPHPPDPAHDSIEGYRSSEPSNREIPTNACLYSDPALHAPSVSEPVNRNSSPVVFAVKTAQPTVTVQNAVYDHNLPDGKVDDSLLWDENIMVKQPDQVDELQVHPSPNGTQQLGTDQEKDSTKQEKMQERLRHMWNEGKPWTEKQKKNLIDFCNEFLDAKLPSFHKIQGTPFNLRATVMYGGRYIYIGSERGIRERLLADPVFSKSQDVILLHINVDGIPFANKAKRHLWPILVQFSTFPPVTVAVYDGDGKPDDLGSFICPFLEELDKLESDGVQIMTEDGERVIAVQTRCWTCDAPARAWLKNVKGHGGYSACDKCTMPGVRSGRRTVHDRVQYRKAVKRNDEDFQNMKYYARNDKFTHQKGWTPLLNYNVGCVSQFTIDFMHCVCLGVMKRLLTIWLTSSKPIHIFQPLKAKGREKLNDLIASLGKCMPSDFTRQEMRTVDDIAFWKAKELRSFLLYTGPILVQRLFEHQPIVFDHFMYLHCAMRVLCHDDKALRTAAITYAKQWLEYWVDSSITLYGPQFPVYNVHLLTHLADEVDMFGCSLDDLSCFPFENHLQSIKNFLSPSTKNAAISVARHLHRSDMIAKQDTMKHIGTIGTNTWKKQDNCFFTMDDRLAIIAHMNCDGTYECMVYNRSHCEPLFTKPCNSKDLHIWVIDNKTNVCLETHLPRSSLKRKAIFTHIPESGGKYVAIGVLHKLANWFHLMWYALIIIFGSHDNSFDHYELIIWNCDV